MANSVWSLVCSDVCSDATPLIWDSTQQNTCNKCETFCYYFSCSVRQTNEEFTTKYFFMNYYPFLCFSFVPLKRSLVFCSDNDHDISIQYDWWPPMLEITALINNGVSITLNMLVDWTHKVIMLIGKFILTSCKIKYSWFGYKSWSYLTNRSSQTSESF